MIDFHTDMQIKMKKAVFFGFVFLCTSASGSLAQTRWVASWATSPQLDDDNALKPDELREGTLRQIVHLSLGGHQIRLHLSNRYGTEALHFISVHVAKAIEAGSAKIVKGSDKEVLFSGKQDIVVPEGADYVSDAIDFSADALSDIAITMRVGSTKELTGHPGSRANSFLENGNAVSAEDFPDAKRITRWYFLAGVDVAASSDAFAIVALGDSITDGHGATTDGNNRWPDILAKRLQTNPTTKKVSVVNQGIGGNRLLIDGIASNALARFDHDVLAQAATRWVIVLEGINDLGMLTHEKEVSDAEHETEVKRVIGAYEQIIARAHAQGIRVIGATVMPFTGSAFYHPDAKNEADRQAVNTWIRTPGHFDAVVDFDKVTRDPAHPEMLSPAYDSGDHLHPGPAGFAAMADAVPLSLFAN